MLDELITQAYRRWPQWFDDDMPPRLDVGILGSRPSHADRALVFVSSASHSAPWVVLKIALNDQEAGSLRSEHWALRQVRTAASPKLRTSIPEPLDEWSVRQATILAIRGMEGHRLVVPALASEQTVVSRLLLKSFLTRAFRWSDELARTTARSSVSNTEELVAVIERFGVTFPLRREAARDIASFAKAVGQARIRWVSGWQHGDVGFGNALACRRRLHFLDWEQAQPSSQPWLDVAYAPATLAGLALRQAQLPSLTAAATAILRPGAWAGRVARSEMERVWRYPLPIPWAVVTTVMWKALRLRSEGREGWAELAVALVTDRDFRRSVSWLAPEW
jgi:hypothetical protein